MTVHTVELLSYHEIRVGQIHRRPTRPKIRVGLVLHVLQGSGAYDSLSILLLTFTSHPHSVISCKLKCCELANSFLRSISGSIWISFIDHGL